MLDIACNYFIIFIIYSFLGWAFETGAELIRHKKFVNRGFLIGPICPVYGIGTLLITIFLTRYANDIAVIFCTSALLCGTLEYFTSYLMEKLFGARWWDYSNFKLNINGRVCLEVIFLFAIAGVLIITVTNPLIYFYILNRLGSDVKLFIFAFLGTILLIDIALSLEIMSKIKEISENVSKEIKDNTEEISTKVKEVILKKTAPYKRIVEAFPHLIFIKVKRKAREIKNTAEKVKDMTKENINMAVDITKENFNNAVDKTKENLNNVKEKAIKSVQDIRNKK